MTFDTQATKRSLRPDPNDLPKKDPWRHGALAAIRNGVLSDTLAAIPKMASWWRTAPWRQFRVCGGALAAT